MAIQESYSVRQRVSDDEPIVIRNPNDLEELLKRKRSLMARSTKAHIALDIPDVDPNVRSLQERRLSRLYSDCGCSWGASAGLFVLVGYTGLMMTDFGPDLDWKTLPIGLLIFILGIGLGKAVGLARARNKMRHSIADLMRERATESVTQTWLNQNT